MRIVSASLFIELKTSVARVSLLLARLRLSGTHKRSHSCRAMAIIAIFSESDVHSFPTCRLHDGCYSQVSLPFRTPTSTHTALAGSTARPPFSATAVPTAARHSAPTSSTSRVSRPLPTPRSELRALSPESYRLFDSSTSANASPTSTRLPRAPRTLRATASSGARSPVPTVTPAPSAPSSPPTCPQHPLPRPPAWFVDCLTSSS